MQDLSTPKVRKETIGSLSNTSNLSCNINLGKVSNHAHTRTSSQDDKPKISLNDLKSPMCDVHVYSNQSNSNSRGLNVNKSGEEINDKGNEKENMQILSNTNLFSHKNNK